MAKTIEVNFPGGKRVDAKIGDVLIKTDQSKANGGEGSFPEPFELFLTSLATCAGIYALDFCQTRGVNTDDMVLKMICERDREKKLYTKMSFNLTLPKDFPEKYRKAITRSMELCSVKKHLQNPPEITVNLE